MTIEVVDASDAQRYEARRNGELLGFADYQRTADLVVFTHTEIDPQHGGQCVGSTLVRAALNHVRELGLKVLAVCPFVEAYLRRHPDYIDLDYRAPFATGPSELGVHPTLSVHEGKEYRSERHHQIALMCDDIQATVAELVGRGAEFTGGAQDMGVGLGVMLQVPGAEDLLLYEPRHAVAYDRT